MNWKEHDEFIENKLYELKDLINSGRIKEIVDLREFIHKLISDFLVERREKAPKVLEIIPDFDAAEFAALLQGDLEAGDKIEIRTPQYLIESIVEEVRIISDIKLKYKH